MGLQNCKTTEGVFPQAQYYFKQLEYDINTGKEDAGMLTEEFKAKVLALTGK